MGLKKIDAYLVECDGKDCKELAESHSEFSIFADEIDAIEAGNDNDWTQWDESFFCPACADLELKTT